MRAVIQRVSSASVSIEQKKTASIDQGLLILLAIESLDSQEDIDWLCNKIIQLRIFNDQYGIMNFSASDIDAQLLVVSQFTLFAKTKKGNRPSYIKAAPPSVSVPLYESFISTLQKLCTQKVVSGEFGADMKIDLTNYGPVTIIIDTKNKE
jgi:D-tyrosyl-tRNA(Tyr) deacylase|tara:strand:+ start:488 stop:940 length:453 start_codon:yes stop_codon:yes gene_type:complete